MIYGIGTDICDIRRVQATLERRGERFAQKVLGPQEMVVFQERSARTPARGVRYLATRFAAKEAFSKAMGTGIRFPVNWHNVWLENERSGRPVLRYSEALQGLMQQRGVVRSHLSITDETGMASAFVILEGPAA